jgi:D-alanyl-D-alanine carboxypeptidase (penicillin-binding protein 5/6)
MTAYVVFQLIKDDRISLKDEVKISKKAWQTGGSSVIIVSVDSFLVSVLFINII